MSKHNTQKNSRFKISPDKLYSDMCTYSLFGEETNTVIGRLAKINGYTLEAVEPLFYDAIQKGFIAIEDKKVINKLKIVQGTVKSMPGDKFCYVVVGDKEIYVNDRGLAVDKDQVEIALRTMFGKQEGVITKILNHAYQYINGDVIKKGNEFIFKPSSKKFDIPVVFNHKGHGDCAGQKVRVKLSYANVMPDNTTNCVLGTLDKIYGKSGDPIVENIAIAAEHGFVKEFDDEIMAEIEDIPDYLTDEDKKGLVDLTHLPFCTIDPKTCKDVDDAIYVEKAEDGYVAYVALADVQHYVKSGSKLDREAFKRATSCYLGDGVYPMLPEKLSNGICSLNENENRRTFVGKLHIDKNGNILDYEFLHAVIRSRHKLTYEQAQMIHEGQLTRPEFDDVKESIKNAYGLSKGYFKKKESDGALVLNNTEPTFVLNGEKDDVEEVQYKTNLTSTKVIESLMCLYDIAMGDFFSNKDYPAIYRIHEKPSKEKMQRLEDICHELGIKYNGSSSAKDLQNLIESVVGLPYEDFVNKKLLMNLEKAEYSLDNIGHFATANKNYIHSTAGIRRYGDIIMQRFLAAELHGEKVKYSKNEFEKVCEYLTEREISADLAERESDQLMYTIRAEALKYSVLSAKISHINLDGLYVQTLKEQIPVFIPYEKLGFGKEKDVKPSKYRTKVVNVKTKKEFKVGDCLNIIIDETDRNTRTIIGERVRDLTAIKPQQTENIKEQVSRQNEGIEK